jgi:hypothetical protein
LSAIITQALAQESYVKSKKTLLSLGLSSLLTVAAFADVEQPHQFGYIDKKGNWIIKPQFDDAAPFKNGVAGVCFFKKNVAYSTNASITTKGELIESPAPPATPDAAALEARLYSEGLRPVSDRKDGELRHFYADQSGNMVIPPLPDVAWAGQFHEGLAPIHTLHQGWHYIDKTGKTVISLPETVSRAGDFCAGLAPVAVGGWEYDHARAGSTPRDGAKWGFINKQGKFVIKPTFDCWLPGGGAWEPRFHDGRASVYVSIAPGQHAFGYIDEQGNLAIKPTFDDAREFSEGLAAVRTGSCQFDPAVWKSSPEKREQLARLFFEKYELIGMTSAEIRGLLGQPDTVPLSATAVDMDKRPLSDPVPTNAYLIAQTLRSGSGGSHPPPYSFRWLEIDYRAGKVWRYRIWCRVRSSKEPTYGDWISERGTPFEKVISPTAHFIGNQVD